MHFSTVAALLFAAVGTANGFPTNAVDENDGFYIPDGAADGIYSVFVHANGTEEHTRVGDAMEPAAVNAYPHGEAAVAEDPTPVNTLPLAARGDIRKRWDVQCYTDEGPLNATDYHRTAGILDFQCKAAGAVSPKKQLYAISGCAVSYFCNFRHKKKPQVQCTPEQRQETFGIIEHACGALSAGSAGVYRQEMRRRKVRTSFGVENVCSDRGRKFCGKRHKDVVKS
ncbi:hypothetical protein PG993_012706 [Apiospora rasikravindrae]|uniref:Uncharacterized protein n=1 Tax=Apiospora rasikravindrae TaxID=990691 RepID=A0ABR1S3E4_9PEZI